MPKKKLDEATVAANGFARPKPDERDDMQACTFMRSLNTGCRCLMAGRN